MNADEQLHIRPSEGPCQVHEWPTEGLAERLVTAMRASHGKGGINACVDCIERARASLPGRKLVTAESLAVLLEGARCRTANEMALQDEIAAVLHAAGVAFERERRLSAEDRPDFMVGAVALEVKIKGSLSEVTRQLSRYAQHDQVAELLLVTTRLQLVRVPRFLNAKPVRVAALLGGF